MSDSPQYEAFRAFAREAIKLEVFTATKPLEEQIRTLRAELATRAVPEPRVIEGPPGKDGKDGRDGVDGKDGAPGEKGERGTDGMVTVEQMLQEIEKRVAEINVRTFADIWKGVYKPGDLYTRGVLTTWGGSLWLSLNETKAKPGETPDWKLVVKK